MAVIYPEGPFPIRRWAPPGIPALEPGLGINAAPLEGQELLDFTAPLGRATGVYYSLSFQLPRWGFWRGKIEEWIFVSPVFREYYEITLRQKEALEATIKSGLASIATAISDLELVLHDLRKYKEFLDYYRWIERGKKLIKEGKKEEGEREMKKGEQALKGVFIDLVDAHTGPGIAMREIAVRWPTIIADFMKLTDEDVEPEKIAKKYNLSIAEGHVLATKNTLYKEWRDRLFKETVKRRYESLVGMAEARRKSILEYKEMLRPSIARHKMISDALSSSETRAMLYKSFFRPDAQAISIDFMKLWAWKPFAPEEKYKVVRSSFDKIPAVRAGFTPEEVRRLEERMPNWDSYVEALPMEPSIDTLVRRMKGEIEKEYNVTLDEMDMYKAREMLITQFRDSLAGLGMIEPWVFSPYYSFLEIPISRTVIRIPPAGPELENIMVTDLFASTQTQNFIICHCLEFIARDKQMDAHLAQMLGEAGVKEGTLMEVEKMVKAEFPEIYKTEEEIEKEKEMERKLKIVKSFERPWVARYKMKETADKIRKSIGNFFKSFGLDVMFFRAVGPYEFVPYDRLTKFYQLATGEAFGLVRDFLKTKFEVPGVEVHW